MKKETTDDVINKLEIAKLQLTQSLKTRLDVNKVMNQLIWGNSNGAHYNCPPGYDNEGNITPNQNF